MKDEINTYTDLYVWKIAHALRLSIYKIVPFLPKDEKYNIISQIKRSSCSIASNIAEGYGRYHFQENIQFCRQARGSLDETKDHLIFIVDATLMSNPAQNEEAQKLIITCDSIKYVLNAYISSLIKQKSSNQDENL